MEITYKMALEVITHEAIVRQAYKDSVGVWTWGVGLTSKSGHSVERYIGNPQPMQKVLEVFVWALQKYADDVEAAFAPVKLTEAQKAAALSFHWNTGAIKTATWVKSFKQGNIAAAKKEIMNWKTPAEIIPRREAERDLFFDGKWSQNGKAVEYTKLTSKSTPVWSSRTTVDIEAPLKAAMGQNATEKPAESDKEDAATKLLRVIFELLKSFFGGKS